MVGVCADSNRPEIDGAQKTPVLKDIFKLSYPVVLTYIIQMVLPLSSTLFLGHSKGGDAELLLSGSTLGNMLVNRLQFINH